MSVVAPANATRVPVSVDERRIESGTIFASAARTASVDGATMTNPGNTGVIVVIKSTAFSATPSVVFTIQGYDPAAAAWYTLLASAAVTGVVTIVMTVLPSVVAAANVAVSQGIPATWRVIAVAGDADSITYSVGYSYIG
jgi:hypothetical protein